MTTGNGSERRRFQRIPLAGSVRIYSGTRMWTSRLIDLSLRGVLVERPEDWNASPGARFRLDLRFEGGLVIGMAVELVRVRIHDLAFSCQKIDLDSFSRLKRLLEINLRQPTELQHELEVLLASTATEATARDPVTPSPPPAPR